QDRATGGEPAAKNEGHLGVYGVVVEEVAGLEVVGAIDDDIGRLEEVLDVFGREVRGVGLDLDRAVDRFQSRHGGLGFGNAGVGVGFGVERLPLEVRRLDDVAVDEDEPPYASPTELIRRCAA